MARQSKAQKETVERVMHEFKHGDLESGSGRKVKSRKQAVAIAFKESGSSKYESPKKNRENLAKTKRRERRSETGRGRGARTRNEPTRAELYEQAKRRNIPGRSKMKKDELKRALGK